MVAKVAAAGAAVAAVLGFASSSAFAQQAVGTAPGPTYERRGYLENKVPAPESALELSAGGGYTQPFGLVQAGRGFPSIAGEGVGVDLGIAARATPHVSVGIGGELDQMTSQAGTAVRGLRAGIDVTLHTAPYQRVDPFVQLGAGYRGIMQRNPTGAPDVYFHGFELARLGLGLDIRASNSVALGPVVGGDLNMFMWQSTGGNTTAIANPRLNTFVFGGLQGRFDFGGSRVTETAVVPVIADR